MNKQVVVTDIAPHFIFSSGKLHSSIEVIFRGRTSDAEGIAAADIAAAEEVKKAMVENLSKDPEYKVKASYYRDCPMICLETGDYANDKAGHAEATCAYMKMTGKLLDALEAQGIWSQKEPENLSPATIKDHHRAEFAGSLVYSGRMKLDDLSKPLAEGGFAMPRISPHWQTAKDMQEVAKGKEASL